MILKVISAVKIPVKTWKRMGIRAPPHLGGKEPLVAGGPCLLRLLAPAAPLSWAAGSDCIQAPSGCWLSHGPVPWGHLWLQPALLLYRHDLPAWASEITRPTAGTHSSGRRLGSGEAGVNLNMTQLQTPSSLRVTGSVHRSTHAKHMHSHKHSCFHGSGPLPVLLPLPCADSS